MGDISSIKDFIYDKMVRDNIIRLLSFILIILIISNIVIYYFLLSNVYLEQLEKSKFDLVEQVATSYELMLKHIKDSVYQTAVYDNELLDLIDNYQPTVEYKIRLFNKLNGIIMLSEYVHSVYILVEDENLVFDTNGNTIKELDKFDDKEIFDKMAGKNMLTSEPRKVKKKLKQKNLISICSTAPLFYQNSNGVLVVNVDANLLYQNILKKINIEGYDNIYVCNSDGQVIIHKRNDELNKELDPVKSEQNVYKKGLSTNLLKKDERINIHHFSKALQWTFVLESTLGDSMGYKIRTLNFIKYSFILFFFCLLIMFFIQKVASIAIKQVNTNRRSDMWRQFLMGYLEDGQKVKEQFTNNEIGGEHSHYAIMVLQFSTHKADGYTLQQDIKRVKYNIYRFVDNQCNIMVDEIYEDKLVILAALQSSLAEGEGTNYLIGFCQMIYEDLAVDSNDLYIGISSIKSEFEEIPQAYGEAIQALEYKIINSSHLIPYPYMDFNNGKKYKYPYTMEKHLVNNIMAGNKDEVEELLKDFLYSLAKEEYLLADVEIYGYITQLRHSIRRGIQSSPKTIIINEKEDLPTTYDMNEIVENMMGYIHKVMESIHGDQRGREDALWDRISEYIEQNYTKKDFNLNAIADDLTIDRGQVGKIVRTNKGKNFNEYINIKRVHLAKELMENNEMTIEEISSAVGFNYSYYFIKIFKTIEGVTPGQYRKKIPNEG